MRHRASRSRLLAFAQPGRDAASSSGGKDDEDHHPRQFPGLVGITGTAHCGPSRRPVLSRARSRRSWNGGAFTATAQRRKRETCRWRRPPPRSKGGDSGPAIVPGKPDESLLLDMIAGDPARDAAEGQAALEGGSRRHPELDRARRGLARRAGSHRIAGSTASAGGPSSRSSARRSPRSTGSSWVRTPIDAFILADAQGQGSSPAPRPIAAR